MSQGDGKYRQENSFTPKETGKIGQFISNQNHLKSQRAHASSSIVLEGMEEKTNFIKSKNFVCISI